MENLRIKLTLGGFTVELEGPPKEVTEQFANLKEHGLGEMIEQLKPIATQAREPQPQPSTPALLGPTSSPADASQGEVSLQDIVLRMLPKAESEWILVYGYYLSEGGKSSFSRDDIVTKYQETSRKNPTVIKNLSSSIKQAAKYHWISSPNTNIFVVTPDGQDKFKEIISRKNSAIKISRKRPEPKAKE